MLARMSTIVTLGVIGLSGCVGGGGTGSEQPSLTYEEINTQFLSLVGTYQTAPRTELAQLPVGQAVYEGSGFLGNNAPMLSGGDLNPDFLAGLDAATMIYQVAMSADFGTGEIEGILHDFKPTWRNPAQEIDGELRFGLLVKSDGSNLTWYNGWVSGELTDDGRLYFYDSEAIGGWFRGESAEGAHAWMALDRWWYDPQQTDRLYGAFIVEK